MKTKEENIKHKIRELRSQLPDYKKCSRCPNPLFNSYDSSDTEPYKIGEELVCRNCYFDALGEEIEQHPIGVPMNRR